MSSIRKSDNYYKEAAKLIEKRVSSEGHSGCGGWLSLSTSSFLWFEGKTGAALSR